MNLQEKLEKLYPGRGKEIHNQIKAVVKNFRKKNKKIADSEAQKEGPLFSQKDLMLICYADHVQEKGKKTFQTMNKFLQKYARGCFNKIHFLPFYPWSSDDGFSVMDYYGVKDSYGNWNDVNRIDKEFGFMFDLVLNHASVKGEWFQKFLKEDEKYKNFFVAYDDPVDVSKVFRPRIHPLLTPFKTKSGKKYVWTTFSEDQADLNYTNPEVLLEMIRVLLFYFKQGAEAIRLDAVAYCWKDLGTNCFNLPEDHLIVQIFRDVAKMTAPSTWIISETVLPHRKNIEYFGDGHNEAHLIYNFVLETLLMHMFVEQDVTLVTDYLQKINNNSLSEECSFLNLSVSHDGIHVIPGKEALNPKQMMKVAKDLENKGGEVLYRTTENGNQEPYEFNITYPSAIGGVKKYLASQAIQLALQGVPLVYLNNFIGVENWKEGVKELGHSRAINRQKFDFEKLSCELDDCRSKKYLIYRGYVRLIKARISESLFSPLVDQKFLKLDQRIMAILRTNGQNKLLALTNVSDEKVFLDEETLKNILKKDVAVDIISKNEILLSEIYMKPFQVLWLR